MVLKPGVLALTVGLSLGVISPLAVSAQTSSPVASPIAGVCDAPDLPPGTPSPIDPNTGMPVASPMAGDMASPTAGEQASPAAAATPAESEGTPADAAVADDVITAITSAIACYNSGDFLGLAASFSPEGLASEFGITNPYDIELAVAGGPPLVLSSIGNVVVHDDGRYSADLVLSFGGAQIERVRWFVVQRGDDLLVDGSTTLPTEAPEGAVTIEAAMVDYAFELSTTTVAADTPLVFQVRNEGEYPHELVIVQLPEGATVDAVLEGEVGFEEIEFFGATYSEGGQPAPDLVLTGLPAGTYTIVCFVDIPEGIPHVARGMVAELVVE